MYESLLFVFIRCCFFYQADSSQKAVAVVVTREMI